MGATCYCSHEVDYVGSVFYRKIDTKLEKTGKPELDEVFQKADDPLEESEKQRKIIANAFKEMTLVTGTVVLKRPDLEQSIRAFLIRFLMEIKKNITVGGFVNGFSQVGIQNLFTFDMQPPYLKIDEVTVNKLKEQFNVNPFSGELGAMLEAIIGFLKTLQGIGERFLNSIRK